MLCGNLFYQRNQRDDRSNGREMPFVSWSTLSAGAVLAFIYSASWVLSQVFLMWGNNV